MTDPAAPAQTEQLTAPAPAPMPLAIVASSGGRQIFVNITRTLTDAELTSAPVIKLIIDRMHTAEEDRDQYKRYVDLYHDANGQVAVLTEKLKKSVVVEIQYGFGLAAGGAILGVTPVFWDKSNLLPGILCLVMGTILMAGAAIVRALGSTK